MDFVRSMPAVDHRFIHSPPRVTISGRYQPIALLSQNVPQDTCYVHFLVGLPNNRHILDPIDHVTFTLHR
jgi:hypothetical protein